ncbi:mechanosensitive ion channel family protein [Ornithinibacillus halophilus]|uniref:Small conductance mechanosensitive channel n=1 Tax=Ornithinibacillus halophilus TaxID=930117 RepID=A0A1M5L5B9_9BACI|nr:mechanosensitive ion channel family protein [Ornithinibacillus halophilus]SHG60217.1 small conductance mechanosensitive channel [Ornithinibacillus halophilus]
MLDWVEDINWTEMLVDAGLIILKLIAIFIVYSIAKKIGSRLIEKAFDRTKQSESSGRVKTLKAISKNIFTYFLLFIVIGNVLVLLGLDIATLLAGAGIVGLAVGFGAQGLVSDIVTGFFILLENQIDVEDYVTVAGQDGIIEEIGLRTTKVRGFDGTLHYIPNREITSVSNHSRGNMRALVDIRISYNDNVDRAMQILQEACDQLASQDEMIIEGPDVVGVQALGSSDVVIRVIAKTQNMEQWAVERRLRKTLKEALEQNGIEIPYPHQVFINKSE